MPATVVSSPPPLLLVQETVHYWKFYTNIYKFISFTGQYSQIEAFKLFIKLPFKQEV